MSSVRPVLRIFDISKTLEFYIGWLGFRVDWEYRYDEHFPVYMQISKDDIVFHLSEHYGDACPELKCLSNIADCLKLISRNSFRRITNITNPDYRMNPGENTWKSLTLSVIRSYFAIRLAKIDITRLLLTT